MTGEFFRVPENLFQIRRRLPVWNVISGWIILPRWDRINSNESRGGLVALEALANVSHCIVDSARRVSGLYCKMVFHSTARKKRF